MYTHYTVEISHTRESNNPHDYYENMFVRNISVYL